MQCWEELQTFSPSGTSWRMARMSIASSGSPRGFSTSASSNSTVSAFEVCGPANNKNWFTCATEIRNAEAFKMQNKRCVTSSTHRATNPLAIRSTFHLLRRHTRKQTSNWTTLLAVKLRLRRSKIEYWVHGTEFESDAAKAVQAELRLRLSIPAEAATEISKLSPTATCLRQPERSLMAHKAFPYQDAKVQAIEEAWPASTNQQVRRFSLVFSIASDLRWLSGMLF